MMSITASKSKLSYVATLNLAVVAICVAVFSCFVPRENADTPKVWSRAISTEAANSEDRAHGLALYYVDQDEFHLTGTWWYENGAVGNKIPDRVIIEGTKAPDGVFRPDVTLQVRNETTGKWETVTKPSGEGQPATVIIEPNSRNFDLTVNLDALKDLIGKCATGRIILNTGEASEFQLKYLLPPETNAQ